MCVPGILMDWLLQNVTCASDWHRSLVDMGLAMWNALRNALKSASGQTCGQHDGAAGSIPASEHPSCPASSINKKQEMDSSSKFVGYILFFIDERWLSGGSSQKAVHSRDLPCILPYKLQCLAPEMSSVPSDRRHRSAYFTMFEVPRVCSS